MVQFWQVGCVESRSLLAMVAMIEDCDGDNGDREIVLMESDKDRIFREVFKIALNRPP